MKTDAELFEEAADILEKSGHYKGDGDTFGDNNCVMTALRKSVINNNNYKTDPTDKIMNRLVCELADSIGLDYPNTYAGSELVLWNDDPATTKERIVKEMKKCASEL